jgi:hypothetical protein
MQSGISADVSGHGKCFILSIEFESKRGAPEPKGSMSN